MKKNTTTVKAGYGTKEITTYEFGTLEEAGKEIRGQFADGTSKYDLHHYSARAMSKIIPSKFLDDLISKAGFPFVAFPNARPDYDVVAALALEAKLFELDEPEDYEMGDTVTIISLSASRVDVCEKSAGQFEVTIVEYFG